MRLTTPPTPHPALGGLGLLQGLDSRRPGAWVEVPSLQRVRGAQAAGWLLPFLGE